MSKQQSIINTHYLLDDDVMENDSAECEALSNNKLNIIDDVNNNDLTCCFSLSVDISS